MSSDEPLPFQITPIVRDTCLCLHTQRAARALARHFDEAFRPFDLTNGQFSLLMALNRPQPPAMGEVAALLAMDRTTLTAALKPLQARGLVEVRPDGSDRRMRRLLITAAGRSLLARAYPVWREAHAAVDRVLGLSGPERLRADLLRVTWPEGLSET